MQESGTQDFVIALRQYKLENIFVDSMLPG